MASQISASGEWILPMADVPSSGPVEQKSSPSTESHICYECSHSFRTCECKSCLKCGTPFMKYFGTSIIKGRSHCRMCSSPVCITCIVLIKGLEKICTRCHLKQREEEISTEKALSAIGEAKFGSYFYESSNFSKLKTMEQKNNALFEAAKKGHDHIVVTLLNMGCNVNVTDSSLNSPIFYAVEGGFLQCVVLLLEKGADVKIVNNIDWTLLHTVAWKGTCDTHVEVAELLLEMGVDILAVSNIGETAADVAERCHAKPMIVKILRSAEVECAVEELNQKASAIVDTCTSIREKRFGKLILSLISFIKTMNDCQNKTSRKVFDLVVPAEKLPKTHSLDRSTLKKSLCEKCGGSIKNASPKSSPTKRPANTSSPTNTKKTLSNEHQTTVRDLEGKIEKLSEEKKEWEGRCRKLMASIALSNKEHQKQIAELEKQLERLNDEKTTEIIKCEAAYMNKLSKIRQETDFSIQEFEERLEQSEQEKVDLLHLQKQYKLTWIPDEIISECYVCRTPFSKTNRKHHCRCCGRIFCAQCSQNKCSLLIFGYQKHVRVCNSCFALFADVAPKTEVNKLKSSEAAPIQSDVPIYSSNGQY